jgi:CHASE3 domain sensor protein
MIRKTALQLGAAALLALILWNGYVAVTHLKQMQKIAALTLQSATIQAKISGVLNHMTDMETGQRGFLLTGNPSYLRPYTQAKDRIAADFASLHAGLVNRGESEQSIESQLESLASSKQAEMEHTIALRQQGYRHRAFKLVDSNEGMEYMDKARELLSSLAGAETSSFAAIETERIASQSKASKEAILANMALLVMAVCLFALVRFDRRVLEQQAAQSAARFASHDFQLSNLMSALSNQARSKTSAIEANARLLLQEYGGFLPRHAHECAEQIEEASVELEQLRQQLVGGPDLNGQEAAEQDKTAFEEAVA